MGQVERVKGDVLCKIEKKYENDQAMVGCWEDGVRWIGSVNIETSQLEPNPIGGSYWLD